MFQTVYFRTFFGVKSCLWLSAPPPDENDAFLFISRGSQLIISGDYSNAISELENALEIFNDLDNQVGLSSVLYNLGIAYLRNGEVRRAESYFDQALSLTSDGTGSWVAELSSTALKEIAFREPHEEGS